MDLVGTLKYSDNEYILSLRDNKGVATYALFDKYHREDALAISQGRTATRPVMNERNYNLIDDVDNYLIGIVTRTKSTGVVTSFGQNFQILNLLNDLGTLQVFRFPESNVITDTYNKEGVDTSSEFEARMDTTYFSFRKENNIFQRLEFSYNGSHVRLLPGRLPIVMKEYSKQMTQIEKSRQKSVSDALLNSMDYKTLRAHMNLNWYQDEISGQKYKEYIAVTNKLDFEELVINDMINEIIRCRLLGIQFRLVFDTETDGLTFLNLPRDSELLNKLVCISLSWKENHAALIFLDMEYFDNMDLQYACNRLKPFLERDLVSKEDTSIKQYVKESPSAEVNSDVPEGSTLVSAFTVNENGTIFQGYNSKDFSFNRDEIELITHNGMFDGKVMYHYGVRLYFDMDTLQLAFNLNPKLGKGNNKLENLIDKLLNVKVPSLSLLLGKGNEGGYRFIKDLTVALIYAGSDTDNLRPIHAILKEIAEEVLFDESNPAAGNMYSMTVDQDIFLMNQLFIMEYNGLRIDKVSFKREADIIKKRMAFLEQWLHRYVGTLIRNNNIKALAANMVTSGATKEQVQEFWTAKMKEPATPYEFELTGDSLRKTLFEVLRYPVKKRGKPSKSYPAGVPSVDKGAVEGYKNSKRTTPANIATKDLVHPEELDSDGKPIREDAVLVKAKDINSATYPVFHILERYAVLKKEYESYFAPFLSEEFGTIISRGFSMTRIETRRIMNPLQTMKARLKRYILPYTEDHYKVVFDQSQVEPRIMMSLAKAVNQIIKFLDPEVDYHTENAAAISKIPAHILPKEIRKKFKEITLGLPYGLGFKKMCLRIFKDLTDENVYNTLEAIEQWQKANKEIWEKLNEFRSMGLSEAQIPEKLRDFIHKVAGSDFDTPYGKAINLIGFYRLFDLTNYKEGIKDADGKVMRPAGNYPIQSFAAELFRKILKRLVLRLHKEGLDEKVMMHMLVHDEATMSAHKTVHPMHMIKILYESCVVSIKGHTMYYIGINIGDNWADCKDDELECPINFVKEVVSEWDKGGYRNDDYWNWKYSFRDKKGKIQSYTGPKAYIYEKKQEFMVKRIVQCIDDYMPGVKENRYLDIRTLIPKFVNYTVRSYVTTFFPPNVDVKERENETEDELNNRHLSSRLESVLLDHFGEGFKYVDSEGVAKVLKRRTYEENVVPVGDLLDLIAEFEVEEDDKTAYLQDQDSYYSFDPNEVRSYEHTSKFEDFDQDETLLSDEELIAKNYDKRTVGGKTILVEKVKTSELKYVTPLASHVNLTVPFAQRQRVKQAISANFRAVPKGHTLIFNYGDAEPWIKVDPATDFKAMDKLIQQVLDG